MKESIKRIIDQPILAAIVTIIYAFSAGPSLIKSNNIYVFSFAIFLGIAIFVWWLYFTKRFINRNSNG